MLHRPAAGAMDYTTTIHRKRRKRGTNQLKIVCLFDIVNQTNRSSSAASTTRTTTFSLVDQHRPVSLSQSYTNKLACSGCSCTIWGKLVLPFIWSFFVNSIRIFIKLKIKNCRPINFHKKSKKAATEATKPDLNSRKVFKFILNIVYLHNSGRVKFNLQFRNKTIKSIRTSDFILRISPFAHLINCILHIAYEINFLFSQNARTFKKIKVWIEFFNWCKCYDQKWWKTRKKMKIKH